MSTITFDQVLTTARQLPPHERARLIACLAEELVSPRHDDATGNDAWERLKQIGADIAASPQIGLSLTDELTAIRR
jgi:hypothetical protein